MVDKEILNELLMNFSFQGKTLNLIRLGYLQDVVVKDHTVGCVINVTEENAEFIKRIEVELKKRIADIRSVEKVNIVLTGVMPKKEGLQKIQIPGVKNIILVSSGKGGVGKSTIAFWLSLCLAKENLKIGLLDADIYGPSIPSLTDYYNKPEMVEGRMIPYNFRNIKVNSIGYLIPPEKALVWRGPMITKALHQLMSSTDWGDLDFLVIDMPPGTGDIHLTMCEKYKIDGVVMISTPQELSIADVSRAIDMYQKFSLPILGIIKNMSYVDGVDGKNYVFGDGAALDGYSKKVAIEIIAEMPINQYVSEFKLMVEDLPSAVYVPLQKVAMRVNSRFATVSL